MRSVLIANRGEIAVRIARACADAGLRSIAVYADTDLDALHTQVADEAFALHGLTPAQTYLATDKILDVALRAGADAVHPGYGFRSESAAFAQAVIDSGLIWIGPPPSALELLGDKVAARELARRVGAPGVPGTPEPVGGEADVVAFAAEHGLPVAIKAAHGGGGRGLKVARTLGEIPSLFASAVREATAAFGRGECFVERFLERARHVETQCLADVAGTVVVVSTRDCSLQRRSQKLVEEAPAPFLTGGQEAELRRASRALLHEAGYVGAGTCEFLVADDGTIAFLEVNARLQVEHCVSEEVTGIDLVREQLRLAEGGLLEDGDPPVRGHAIEFRINGEDAGRGFLPAPGTISLWRAPGGPGVRVDAGVAAGAVVSDAFDSLLAKLVVSGRDRAEALARARRALAEFDVEGVPTVLPFHRAVVADPAFAPPDPAEPFSVHTRWIETEFAGAIPPWRGSSGPASASARERVVVEVDGRRVEVTMPAASATPSRARRPRSRAPSAADEALTAPMQGTIVSIAVADGDVVAAGDVIVVLEAMKMEQPLAAHKAGTVTDLAAQVGQLVASGAVICQIKD